MRLTKLLVFMFALISLVSIAYAEDNSTNATANVTLNITSDTPAILNIIAPSSSLVNSTFLVQANYTYENGTIAGIDVCRIDGAFMGFNMSSGLYYFEKAYPIAGAVSFIVNCRVSGFEDLTKTGMIEIVNVNITQNITIDMDNDGYQQGVDCDDTDPNINPGKQETLYNGKDDDCNLGTLDYLVFNATVTKTTYIPQETVNIVINARNGSDTYITINTPSNVSYVYIFENGSYPVTQQFSLTSLSGQYSIDAQNYFGEYTRTAAAEFAVSSTMNVVIETNKTEAYVGENIHFKAIITGTIGQVNMIWNMDDTKQRYSQEFNYNFTSPRQYNIVLIATDQGANQVVKTKAITIRDKYYMKVSVVDNATGNPLPNSTVEFDGLKKDTNSSGQVEFDATNKTYDLKVKSDGYITYKDTLQLNTSLLFTVRLNKNLIETPPKITLISPLNNTAVSETVFRFKFSDNQNATCTLFLSEGNGWWVEANSTNLYPEIEHSFSQEIEAAYTYWKIRCIDSDGNAGFSDDYRFSRITKNESTADETALPDTTYNVIQNVYDVLPDFEKYGPDEKKIVAYLNMDVVLKDARRRLEMANRDLFNLRLQPDSDSLMKKRDEIYATIEKIKDETPLSVSSKKKVDFVKYLDDKETEDAFTQYLGLKNIELSASEKKALLAQNKLLQKRFTIQTSAYNVDIQYVSGKKEEVTLVAREISYAGDATGLKYIEFIPKSIAETTSQIVFVNKPDAILQEDPVVEYDLSKLEGLVYYVKQSVALEEIPKIMPVVLSFDITQKTSAITGLAIFDNLGFSDSNTKIFLIQVAIVFVLLGIYLFYNFRKGDAPSPSYENTVPLDVPPMKFEHIGPTMQPDTQYQSQYQPAMQPQPDILSKTQAATDVQKIDYMRALIASTNQLIGNDIEEAALKYHELKFLFELLSNTDREIVHADILRLGDEITIRNLDQLIDLALVKLAVGKTDEATLIYDEMMEEFDKLSEPYKKRIYPKCCDVVLHLKNEA